MPIVSIETPDKKAARTQSSSTKASSFGALGFDDYINASNPVATSAVVAAKPANYRAALATQATLTGVAGVVPSYGLGPNYNGNAAYYGGAGYASSPLMSTNVSAGVGPFIPPVPTTTPGLPGSPGATAPAGFSADYQEKQALFKQMNDANWEMLFAQVTVNNISRDYQARSNILQTKAATERAIVQNLRA